MPKALHKKLVKSAKKAKLTGKRKKAYVYGTMQLIEDRRKAKRKRTAKRKTKK